MSTDTPKIQVPERSGNTSEEPRGNPLHRPTGNKNKNEGRQEVQSDLLHDLPDCLQEFKENLVDERNPSEPWRNLLSLDIEKLPVLLMNHQWSREQKWNQVWVSISVYKHFPKDPNCDVCLKTKNNQGFLQKTCWKSRAQSGKCW